MEFFAYIYAQQNYLPIKRLIKTVGAENTSIESMLREIETRLRQHRTYDAEHTEIIRSRMLLDFFMVMKALIRGY